MGKKEVISQKKRKSKMKKKIKLKIKNKKRTSKMKKKRKLKINIKTYNFLDFHHSLYVLEKFLLLILFSIVDSIPHLYPINLNN